MEEALVTLSETQRSADKPADILEVLLRKRAQLVAELQQHDSAMSKLQEEYAARLAHIREQQRPLQEALQHVEALLRLEGWEGATMPSNGTADLSAPELISYTDAAYRLLEKAGQPMHYKAIFGRLQEQGAHIPGKDPAATLLAKIGRDQRFKRIRKRGTYALSFWRIAAAKSRASTRKKKR